MDLKDIIALINQIGFPIAAFILMFWMAHGAIKENTKAIVELRILVEKIVSRFPTP